jgi:hypothetical protein
MPGWDAMFCSEHQTTLHAKIRLQLHFNRNFAAGRTAGFQIQVKYSE